MHVHYCIINTVILLCSVLLVHFIADLETEKAVFRISYRVNDIESWNPTELFEAMSRSYYETRLYMKRVAYQGKIRRFVKSSRRRALQRGRVIMIVGVEYEIVVLRSKLRK